MAGSGGNSLLAGIYSGLTNTYSYLAAQYPNKVTLENINKARTDSNSANVINQGFASYLQSNFQNIDTIKRTAQNKGLQMFASTDFFV